MLKSSLCDYSDAYTPVKWTITIKNTAAADADANNEKVIFQNGTPFTDCIKSEINNTQVDNAKGVVVVMPMYDLVEYSKNYSKKIGSLWQFCWDEPAVNNGDITAFNANNATNDFFKLKEKRTEQVTMEQKMLK